MDPSNDVGYLQKLVAGLQQQRNMANDLVSHQAALLAQRDDRIGQMQKTIEVLTKRVYELEPKEKAPTVDEVRVLADLTPEHHPV